MLFLRNVEARHRRGLHFVIALQWGDEDNAFAESVGAAARDDPLQIGSFGDWRSAPEDTDYRQVAPELGSARDPYLDYLSVGYGNPFVVHAPILRTDLAVGCGGFNEELPSGEDMDFWARLLRGGGYFSYVPQVVVGYRMKASSMLVADPGRHSDAARQVAQFREQPWEPGFDSPAPITAGMGELLRDVSLAERLAYNTALRLVAEPAAADDALWKATFASIDPVVLRSRWVQQQLTRQAGAAVQRRYFPQQPPESLTESVAAAITAGTLRLVEEAPMVTPRPGGALPNRSTDVVTTQLDAVTTAPLAALVGRRPFLIIGDARYHAYECGPLLQELRRRDVDAVAVMLPSGAVDQRIITDWARFTDVVYQGAPADIAQLAPVGALVMNDWDPRSIEVHDILRQRDVPLLAKVEGVQDYQDVDTRLDRQAYQRADVILAQGQNDAAALSSRSEVHIVGSSRLQSLWQQPPVPPIFDQGLINLNFSYGVLVEHQLPWIDSVITAFEQAGAACRISTHWQQADLAGDPRVAARVAAEPFRYLITRSGLLVSRFSTVPFEARARGVPFVYHNPHGEQVPTFTQPAGAFPITRTAAELADAIPAALEMREGYRDRAAEFFLAQVDIDPDRAPSERAADVIQQYLA